MNCLALKLPTKLRLHELAKFWQSRNIGTHANKYDYTVSQIRQVKKNRNWIKLICSNQKILLLMAYIWETLYFGVALLGHTITYKNIVKWIKSEKYISWFDIILNNLMFKNVKSFINVTLKCFKFYEVNLGTFL